MYDFDAADRLLPFGWFGAGLQIGLPVGLAALHEAQRRNMDAIVAANRAALTGYQAAYARLVDRMMATLAEARDRIEAMHGQPIDAGSAARHIAAAKDAADRAMAELRTLNDMTRTATADAFAILRRRTEEALAEMRGAAERLA